MRVCLISPLSYELGIGGTEVYLINIIEKLQEKGVFIDLIMPGKKEEIEEKDKLTIYKLPYLDCRSTLSPDKTSEKVVEYLIKIFSKKRPDIISVQSMHEISFAKWAIPIHIVAMKFKIPVIATVHWFSDNFKEKQIISTLPWAKIICVSKFVSEMIYRDSTIPVDKIATIYPPIDTKHFREDLGKNWLRSRIGMNNQDPLVMYAGRIYDMKREMEGEILEEKGISNLLQSFSVVAKNFPKAKLLIAACPPYYKDIKYFKKAVEKIKNISSLQGMKDKVIIESFQPKEMPHVYSGADIFVMLSRKETFGLVYAEAMACGIPVIGSSICSIPEIIDNEENGYLIQLDNTSELVRRITYLLKNPLKIKVMGKNARRKVIKNFEAEKMISRLIGVYSSNFEENKRKKHEKRINTTLKDFIQKISKE